MMKVNIGLIGILIIIFLIITSIFYLNTEIEKLHEELVIIKSFLNDIDNDIHELEREIE